MPLFTLSFLVNKGRNHCILKLFVLFNIVLKVFVFFCWRISICLFFDFFFLPRENEASLAVLPDLLMELDSMNEV